MLEQYIKKIDLRLRERPQFPVICDVLREQRDLFMKENIAYYSEHDFILALNAYELLIEERYWAELLDDEGKWDL
jgi:hypothetical protein